MDAAPSDTELLAAWSADDTDAGNALIERHFDLVYRFFRNKVSESDIEDLVQQTFLGCLEARSRFDARSSLATFLLAIARNQLFNFYRKRRREPLASCVSSLRDQRTSPTGAVAKVEDEHLLLEALRRVPLDAQVLLELAYSEGLVAGQIAEVLGVAPSAVHTRLHRARETLRDILRVLAPDRLALADRARNVLARDG